MNKVIVRMLIICAIVFGVLIGFKMVSNDNKLEDSKNIVEMGNVTKNTIKENKTNIIENNIIKETSTNEIKISPNAFITYNVTYEKCGHEKTQFKEIPKDLVNLTEDELKKKYSDWNIDEFSDTNIVLSKTDKGSCDEHFILRDKDGYATVFRKFDDGKEEEYEITSIAVEFLSETDKSKLKDGIEVNGLQNLNQLIEDYE